MKYAIVIVGRSIEWYVTVMKIKRFSEDSHGNFDEVAFDSDLNNEEIINRWI